MSAMNRVRAWACASLAGGAMLFWFPPERYSFYPQCPVFRYLHVYCPGCGATRALAVLVHGRIAEAVHYNALTVLLVPMLLGYLALAYRKARREEVFAWPRIPAAAMASLLVMTAAFGVLRNLFGSIL
jgi:hypothetical protein